MRTPKPAYILAPYHEYGRHSIKPSSFTTLHSDAALPGNLATNWQYIQVGKCNLARMNPKDALFGQIAYIFFIVASIRRYKSICKN
jgi:hypothetical protein